MIYCCYFIHVTPSEIQMSLGSLLISSMIASIEYYDRVKLCGQAGEHVACLNL